MTDPPQGTIVYLSEPPEGGALAETWGETATYQLNVRGYHVYRPVAAWRYADEASLARAWSINRHALGVSDILVAILPSVTGLEVPMEIEAALAQHVPVVVLTGPSVALMLGARRGLTVVHDGMALADTVERVLETAPPVDRVASFTLGAHTP